MWFSLLSGLFNLRGKDVPNNPMFMSYAIVTEGAIYLYLYDKDKRLTQEVKDHLGIGTDPCTNEGRLLCTLITSVAHKR